MLIKSQNLWVYLTLCVIALLPFVIIAHPPIVDFPNHAARLFVECHPKSFETMREIRFGIIPDLAIDLIGRPFCGVVSPERIVTWTIATFYFLICIVVWSIRRALFGKNDALSYLIPAMAFNIVTTMGYVNFLVGTFLLLAMIYVLILKPKIGYGALFVLCTVLGSMIFFCHIFALLLTLVVIAGWLWENRLRDRPALIGLVLSGILASALLSVPLSLVLLSDRSTSAQLGLTWYDEARILVAPLFGFDARDEKFLGVLAIGIVIVLVRSGGASISPAFRRPLWLLVALCAIMPCTALNAVDINVRLVVPLALFAVVVTELKGSSRAAYGLTAIAAVAFLLHLGTFWFVWRPFSAQVTEFRSKLANLPAGAPILSVTTEDGPRLALASDMPYSHLASYAEIDRRIFNPLAFSGKGMQPLSATPAYRTFSTPSGSPITVETAEALARVHTASNWPVIHQYQLDYAANWYGRYPYILFYHFGREPNFDPNRLRIVAEGSFFSILASRQTVSPASY